MRFYCEIANRAQRFTKSRITIEIEYIEVNEFGAEADIDCDIISNVVILNQIVAKTKSLARLLHVQRNTL